MGVRFFFVYKSLAHPEGGSQGYVRPVSLSERLKHIELAYRQLGNTIPWLCDNMENELKHALGDRPNSEFIISPDGKIVSMQDWSRPETLRDDLEKLVGVPKTKTRSADLNLKKEPDPVRIRKNIVERIDVPSQMRVLKVKPLDSSAPFYVKLRVEAEPAVLNGGTGKVYLGFHLDPIHRVHWNNLAEPLNYSISELTSGKLDALKGAATKVKQEADVDPREFLVEGKGLSSKTSFQLTVKYFACSDVEGWCKPVTQQYVINLESDRDGGSARRGSAGQFGRQGGTGKWPGKRPERPSIGGGRDAKNRVFSASVFMENDTDQDGKVSAKEIPSRLMPLLRIGDRNRDNAIDRFEAERIEQRMKNRR
jgi:hypothetical protein